MVGRKPKLSAEQQAELRILASVNISHRQLARRYNVVHSTIRNYLKRAQKAPVRG